MYLRSARLLHFRAARGLFVGHRNDIVTKTGHRHLIEPEISAGADVMDVFR